ncbi:MAG: hypothetical protein WCY38_03165 [Endomicrobiia bacterium]
MAKTRILHILSNFNCDSGATALVFNWHKNIDREKIQFNYMYVADNKHLNFKEKIYETKISF